MGVSINKGSCVILVVVAMEGRIDRALTQRIFLISKELLSDGGAELQVAGLTSDYKVHIDANGRHTCTCMDFKQRRIPCKHIFFSLFRVGRLNPQQWLLCPTSIPQWGSSFDIETEEDCKKRKLIEKADEECAICYELFADKPKEPFTYCESCGHRFHSQCMSIWLRQSPGKNCPLCRASVKQVKRLKVEVLKDEVPKDESKDEVFTFFFSKTSPFSNWYRAPFTIDGQIFTCVEQYMMYAKALLFSDLVIADKILNSEQPKVMKRLGRQVKGFQEELWVSEREEIVKKALRAKFTQHADLRQQLKSTQGTTLVEASPFDRIWGIGLNEKNPLALKRETWRGKNLLGQLLTEVRAEL